MKYDRQNFLSLRTVFLPFYYPNNPKNQNFEKMKQKSADIIILHVYHKWQSHHVLFLRYEA